MSVWALHGVTVLVTTALLVAHGQQTDSCSAGSLPLYKQKQYQEAERRLQSCLSANPDDAGAQELLGLVLAESGAPEPAMEHLRQALKLDGANDDYRFNLAMFLAQANRINDADNIVHPLLKSRAGADVYSLVGYIRLRQHQEREAAAWFEKVVAEAPDRRDAWYRLGFCRQALGEFTPAMSAYRKVIALDSRYALARLQLAKILLLQGDYAAAEDQLQESARLEPGRSSTWRYLSQSQLLGGKVGAAREAAAKAVALSPSDPRSHHQLGLVLKRLGDDAGADVEFQTMEKMREAQRGKVGRDSPNPEDD